MVENFAGQDNHTVIKVGDTVRILDCSAARILSKSGVIFNKHEVGDLAKVVEVEPRYVVLDDDWAYSFNSPLIADEVVLVNGPSDIND